MLSDVGYIVFTAVLCIQSYWDLRYKAVPFVVTVSGAVIGVLLSLIRQRECMDMLCAVVPGLLCLGIGKVTNQAIGYGDGFLLLAMGCYISCERVLSVGMLAVMCSGIVALAFLACRKKKGKDTLPFVPFFLIAWLVHIILEKGFIV